MRHWASASPLPDAEGTKDSDSDHDDESDSNETSDDDEDIVGSGQLLVDSTTSRVQMSPSPDTSEGLVDIQLLLSSPKSSEELNAPTPILEDDTHATSVVTSNGKLNGYARDSHSEHRSSSPFEPIANRNNIVKFGVNAFRPPSIWREDATIDSPLQQKVALREMSSGRSSVVTESVWDVHDSDSRGATEAQEEAPPDTPASLTFDALSTVSALDAEVAGPAFELGEDCPKPVINGAFHQEPMMDPLLQEDEEVVSDEEDAEDSMIPAYLRPYAVTPVSWDSDAKVKAPALLRGTLRPYQQAGLEWLASLHVNNLNGILADEMGLGYVTCPRVDRVILTSRFSKTIQTISLLAHLACDRGIWGPHLIIVPTSVLLNWEMEFKKFLPGFKVLSYHGNTKRRKELRQGWNNKYHFNVCVTSYALASRDAHVFKRKAWYYMILDEAHMIKNFKSQRWNILLMFRSFRRLLLTGTPLQNNLTELWALLQFLMSGTNFANLKEFGEWFSSAYIPKCRANIR